MRAHYEITCTALNYQQRGGGKKGEQDRTNLGWALWEDDFGAGDAGHVVSCCVSHSLRVRMPSVSPIPLGLGVMTSICSCPNNSSAGWALTAHKHEAPSRSIRTKDVDENASGPRLGVELADRSLARGSLASAPPTMLQLDERGKSAFMRARPIISPNRVKAALL